MRIDGLYLRLVRVEHELGADLLVEFLRREEAERDGSLLERGALLVRLLRALRNICPAQLVSVASYTKNGKNALSYPR